MRKTTVREIRGSFGRFFAIFAIIALGVGFFCGVRLTTPLMVRTIDNFYREYGFYDYRLLSTIGWEAQDVAAFSAEDGVRAAAGAFQYDVICTSESGTEAVYKAHSLTEGVNGILVREGRLPERADEVLLDDLYPMGLSIGDQLVLSDANDEETLEHFSSRTYTVVGLGSSSLYINFERGTTSLGNGSVTGFFYLTEEGFAEDTYTEMYLKLDFDEEIYSDAYTNRMDQLRDGWESILQEKADLRYERLYQEAEQELQDAKDTLEEERAEGQAELDDAKAELDDAKAELDDAKTELDDAKAELDEAKAELDDAKTQLEEADAELTAAKAALDSTKAQLEAAYSELISSKAELDDTAALLRENKQLLDASAAVLQTTKEGLDASKAQLDAFKAQLDATAATLAATEAEVNTRAAALEAAFAAGTIDESTYAASWAELQATQQQLAASKAQYETSLAQYELSKSSYETGLAQYEAAMAEYNEGLDQYMAGLAQYNEGLAQYQAGLAQYESGRAQYLDGKSNYEAGLAQYSQSLAAYEDGMAEYEDGMAQYEESYAAYEDGVTEYEDGMAEYEDGLAEFNEKIADAEADLADAEAELADFKAPDTYLLERGANQGYAFFESDSEIVRQVARIFPIFFILVAALVCVTTMTRMVEEQRGQIGVLKALGYSNGTIMGKFAFYAGSAALLGCIFGYVIGVFLFPSVIWHTYQLMYVHLPLRFYFDWKLALLAVIVSLVCSIGSAYASCRYELGESAASLMRPKAPTPGKRVLLERIPFLWSRMKFLHKVSARNILRYKKRFFMMILGISGCTALLLTGFGMHDSISRFAVMQFEEIQIADAELTVQNGTSDALPAEVAEALEDAGAESLLLRETTWTLLVDQQSKEVNVVALMDAGTVQDFFHLHTTDGVELAAPKQGEVLLSVALAKRYDLKAGDTVLLRDDDMNEISVRVSGVFENYVFNYVIASPEDLDIAVNGAYLNFPEDADVYTAQAPLSKLDDVTGITVFRDLENRVTDMLSSMDYIVLVVILSAAGLAFVVLYNLTNINITERIREIATIKVLGFYPRETAQYVFRENVVLTAIGALIGLGLGVLLHRFVMAQIVVDMVHFETRIAPLSYLYSVVLTFVFALAVDLVMRRKLEKINMAESLKSVE